MVGIALHFSQEGFVAEDDFSATADYTREHDDERAFTEARQAADEANAEAAHRKGGAATAAAAASIAGKGPAVPKNGLCLLSGCQPPFDDRKHPLASRQRCYIVFETALSWTHLHTDCVF